MINIRNANKIVCEARVSQLTSQVIWLLANNLHSILDTLIAVSTCRKVKANCSFHHPFFGLKAQKYYHSFSE